jgi:hypothetical protein
MPPIAKIGIFGQASKNRIIKVAPPCGKTGVNGPQLPGVRADNNTCAKYAG